MASVNFEKLKGSGAVKAMLRHCDKEERIRHEHSNKEINKDLTHKNITFGYSYEKTCKRYDDRIEMLDSTTNKNKRKDRVSAFGLTIPAPAGISEEQVPQFFREVGKIIQAKYGKENLLAAYAHFDEIHCYLDHGELKFSRPHLHAYVIPEHEGQLNGKWFSSRKNMIELNRTIEKMCNEKFNVKFMTGEPPRNRTVEELKQLSNQELGEREELVRELQNVFAQNDHMRKSCEAIVNWAQKHNEVNVMDFIQRALEYDPVKAKEARQKSQTIQHTNDYDR